MFNDGRGAVLPRACMVPHLTPRSIYRMYLGSHLSSSELMVALFGLCLVIGSSFSSSSDLVLF